MRNLILLLLKNGAVILFIVLEVICMFLVVEYNQKQSEIYTVSHDKWSGYFFRGADEFWQFLSLSEVNDSLARENARLYQELDNSKYINTLEIDSAYNEKYGQQYTYIAAKIISNSFNRPNNYLILDKGTNHDIRPRMGVISDFGVVGIVTEVSENFCKVVSILHRESRVSAGIRRNNYPGGLVWRDSDPKRMKLLDIPKHATVVKGDTIQTTGFSTYFPAGMMIGLVEDFKIDPGSNFYEIDVVLSNDLSNIKYVYIVDNMYQLEQMKLKEEENEQ